jgi:hypothetical protein
VLELLSGDLLYNFAKDICRALTGRKRKLTSEQKIELRQKWKPLFEEELYKNWMEKLREDVIVRDVRRVDRYPDLDEKGRGISPWFKVFLVDVYHRGIIVAFRWEDLMQRENGSWREKEYGVDEGEFEKAILAGRIPFDNIEAVDWSGDEYYPYPHIYCHILRRKGPYEDIGYYVEIKNSHTRPHYTLLADAKQVQRRRRRKKFWGLMKQKNGRP